MENYRVYTIILITITLYYILNRINENKNIIENEKLINNIIKNCKIKTNIDKVLNKYKLKIDNDLENILKKNIKNPKMLDMCRYSIKGGKRLRSLIAYSIINKLNPTIPQQLLENTNCVELLHSASLILDDIMDNDIKRRGFVSVYKKYGLAQAQLCSSQLVTLSLTLCTKQSIKDNLSDSYEDNDIIINVLNKTSDLIDGQMLDLDNKQIKEDDKVLDILCKKTSSIFEMIFVIAWIVGNGDKKSLPLVRKLADDFGIVYQIYDDFTDYYSDKKDDSLNYIHKSNSVNKAFNEFQKRKKNVIHLLKLLKINTVELINIINYLNCVVIEINNHLLHK